MNRFSLLLSSATSERTPAPLSWPLISRPDPQGRGFSSSLRASKEKGTGLKLDRLSKANGVTKKDFLDSALDYFEKYGINPVKHESPSQEMQKLIKRVDQIIAFIRAQEKYKINPMFEAITTSEKRIKNDLDTIVKVEHFDNLVDALNKIIEGIMQDAEQESKANKTRSDQQIAQNKKIAAGLLILSECLEGGKDRKGLSGAMRNLLGI